MIDIHSHILPAIDDGAQSLEDSLAMAKEAVREGIRAIIATPHHKNGKYENTKSSILQRTEQLNQFLKDEQVDLKILPGQEPRIFGDLIEDYRKGEVATLNNGGLYLFVELPSNHVPRYTKQLLFDIQSERLTPIIVHPERNTELKENPDLLYEFVKNGTLTQLTAASISGRFGKNIQKFSHQMIEANLAHFVASDAHNITSRSFKLNEAYDVIEKKFGIDFVDLYLDNAELLVEGKTVYKEVPEPIKKKRFLGVF
ncbi:tyrosine-protein phosphatase [Bacillus massiliglaciei]|uniref:tyrosine-protein phosphatase n=1 Tax=Bacillus massiliglaciei TaxID=1816693 RepID=UPI000A97B213|nr:CpsB/CapC family capsule biosynthesis tyrosine phosphatase [Bacillus massiliglaciei]